MSAAFDFKPDPNAASPLYMQLAQSLAQAIREGIFHADEALPSERALLRQALTERLAHYQQPAALHFVHRLPRNPLGRLQKAGLRQSANLIAG